jgi:hypothetical protein
MYYRNPLSEKRKFYLQSAFAPRFDLDEEAVKGVSGDELKVRQDRLNQLLSFISQADPSHSGKYAMWIAKLYFKETIQFPEDIDKINQRLTQFESIKRLLPPQDRDINRFKTYGQLARTIDEHTGVSKRESVRLLTTEGQEILFETDKFVVIKVTTQEAATALAKHTEWCIKDPAWGKGYLEWGPFYFIDKLTHKKSTQERYALAWHGKCSKRYDQYHKYKKFIELAEKRGVCILCSEQSEPHSVSCIKHYSELQDLVNETALNYGGFNTEMISGWFTNWFADESDEYAPLKEIFEEFTSNSDCSSRYDVMNVYDEELKDADRQGYQIILPILRKLFEPDVYSSREALLSYYKEIEPGEDKIWEEKLLALKDPTKLVDYYAHLVEQWKLQAGVSEKRIRGRRRKRKRKARKKVKPLGLPRWKAAEKYIFTDYEQAARYYTMLHPHINENEDRELRQLGAELKFTAELPEFDTTFSSWYGQDFPRHWRRSDLRKRKAGIRRSKHTTKNKLEAQKAKIDQQLGALDETYQLKYDRIDGLLDRHAEKEEKKKDAVFAKIKMAEKKLADGAPIYETLVPVIRNLLRTYGSFEVEEYETSNPIQLYLIGLINYYNKGIVVVPAFGNTIPLRLVAAEEFVTNFWRYVKRRRKRKSRRRRITRQRREEVALEKLGRFARAANRAINRRL